MYKATGEYISKEEFIQSSVQDNKFLVFPPETAEQMNARKSGTGRYKRGGNQGSMQMQLMQSMQWPQSKLTITDCATDSDMANSVLMYDDEPTMLKAVQVKTTQTGSSNSSNSSSSSISSISSYGLVADKSVYIPGGGRLDFEISMDSNGGPNIDSITFYKSSLFAGTQNAVKFTP